MSEAKTNTTPSAPNLLFIALMATLAVWLITITYGAHPGRRHLGYSDHLLVGLLGARMRCDF